MGSICIYNCLSCWLVCHKNLVAKFCLQNRIKLVGFSAVGRIGNCNRYGDCELTELAGSNEKSGRGIEVRITLTKELSL